MQHVKEQLGQDGMVMSIQGSNFAIFRTAVPKCSKQYTDQGNCKNENEHNHIAPLNEQPPTVETLSLMTEEELQQFYRENQMLLNKFFTDSDKMRGTPATASETDVRGTERNIARNAEKLLGKMRDILARRLVG